MKHVHASHIIASQRAAHISLARWTTERSRLTKLTELREVPRHCAIINPTDALLNELSISCHEQIWHAAHASSVQQRLPEKQL